jgi:hypothetical protein
MTLTLPPNQDRQPNSTIEILCIPIEICITKEKERKAEKRKKKNLPKPAAQPGEPYTRLIIVLRPGIVSISTAFNYCC